jgi:hypothetical protein
MNILANVTIDDDTIIVIDGVYTVPWATFLQSNSFEPSKIDAMREALHESGEFNGGGGAVAAFHLTLLTHKVIEARLQELRRIRIDESVFFENIEPETLAGEAQRIADEMGRTFTIGGVKLGTRIWRTA